MHSAGYENQLSTHAFIVNTYVDYQVNGRWVLFAGGVTGWSQNVSDDGRVPQIDGNKVGVVTRRNNLTWNLALGFTGPFAADWDTELRYR